MQIRELLDAIEQLAPLAIQEDYDNSGLIVGDDKQEIEGVLVCLDITEAVVEESIAKKCNLIVSHHPILFRGIKKITPIDDTGRILIRAIRHEIAIYAAHTNLDNAKNGLNYYLANRIGLQNLKPLLPMENLIRKMVVFCPELHLEKVRNAVFAAGAGTIGKYDECGFVSQGEGSFRAGEGSNPFVGSLGERHYEKEMRLEFVYPKYLERQVVAALLEAHPYEEVAYDTYALLHAEAQVGAGIIGELPQEEESTIFLERVKKELHLPVVRHTEICRTKVRRIALCGGSGAFLLQNAIEQKADIFLTGDLKYHDFFAPEKRLIMADIGHYESEECGKQLLYDIISQKLRNFAVWIAESSSNPVHYL